jgi:hypothetical protein
LGAAVVELREFQPLKKRHNLSQSEKASQFVPRHAGSCNSACVEVRLAMHWHLHVVATARDEVAAAYDDAQHLANDA